MCDHELPQGAATVGLELASPVRQETVPKFVPTPPQNQGTFGVT